MVKDLEADPFVSERFQFLTFGYSTGDPIPYSAYTLRRAILDVRDRLDPDHSNPAWDRMVLIGHSMGGLLCKMMTQDSGSKLWDLITGSRFENLAGPAKARELLHGSMVFMPIPEVRRLIFITTPHRGSPLVWGPIRDVGTRLARPPTLLQQARASLLASNGPDAFTRTFSEGLATSIDELAWVHPLLLAVDGQEKGMFPGELIDTRRQSLTERPCESVRTVAGQEGGTGLLQERGRPRESGSNVSDRTPHERASAVGRGDEYQTPDLRYRHEDHRPMQQLAGFCRSGQVLEAAAGDEVPELRATVLGHHLAEQAAHAVSDENHSVPRRIRVVGVESIPHIQDRPAQRVGRVRNRVACRVTEGQELESFTHERVGFQVLDHPAPLRRAAPEPIDEHDGNLPWGVRTQQ